MVTHKIFKVGDRVIRLSANVKEEEQYINYRGVVMVTHPLQQNSIDVLYDHNHYLDEYCLPTNFGYERYHRDKQPKQT